MIEAMGGRRERVHVHVEPGGFDLEVRADETLIEAAWREGYYWPTICNGQASCLQCFVAIEAGSDHLVAPDDRERRQLAHLANYVTGEVRLACRLRLTGDASVSRTGVELRG